MGKNKLAHWAEMRSFSNVIQPEAVRFKAFEHPLKGRWNEDYFRNSNPIVLELGCGKGEYTVGLSLKYPLKNFIGIDIKGARIWRGAKTAIESKIPNVMFLRTRIEFLTSFFSEDEIEEIWITFPDPFPKRRNTARRLTSPFFLNSYRTFLKNGGIVHLKTDNRELYNYTNKIIEKNNLEAICSTNDLYSPSEEYENLSIRTHYENIFLSRGIKINYLSFRLDKNKIIEE